MILRTAPKKSGFFLWLSHPMLVALSLLLAPAFWIVFVATLAPHELEVGIATCVATVVFTVFVCRSSKTQLTLRLIDFAQCWRIPWYIVSGVGDITVVLFKDLFGLEPAKNLFRVCGFNASEHDPLRSARMIMAVAYTTTAPNFIVVGIDPSQSRMLFHQISSSSVPKMTKALGARS